MKWKLTDAKEHYREMIHKHRVVFDASRNAWVIYGYNECRQVFTSPGVAIPPVFVPDGITFSDTTTMIVERLARVSNDHGHIRARQVAIILYKHLSDADIPAIINRRLSIPGIRHRFDWVETVARNFSTLVILDALGFSDADSNRILPVMPQLVKLLSPAKTVEDVAMLNKVCSDLDQIVSQWIQNQKFTEKAYESKEVMEDKAEALAMLTANVIGLLIQSYDAGRGLLTNALVALADHGLVFGETIPGVTDFVNEVLRFDGPLHNTLRMAVADIKIGEVLIKKGERILIVIAAANLDPLIFRDPLTFNTGRQNNNQHLSFGYGAHECIARPLMITITAGVCQYLVSSFTNLVIETQELEFEPQQNVRLIKNLFVSFSENEYATR